MIFCNVLSHQSIMVLNDVKLLTPLITDFNMTNCYFTPSELKGLDMCGQFQALINAEKLVNTRVAIQNLGKLTLAGRQQMHGEGAISNSEGGLAERANSGDINFTPAELAQLANAANRVADYQIQMHNQKLQVMRQNPETKSLAPYYEVNPMTPVSTENADPLGIRKQ